MRSLRSRLRSRAPSYPGEPDLGFLSDLGDWVFPRSLARAVSTGSSDGLERTWNTLSTLGAGPVADVDVAGAVFPRARSLAVDLWIGAGDRWWFPAREPGVRQTRLVGLPVVETRLRVGDGDVVWTAWADEGGDGHGRVVIRVETELDVPVVLAVVVRPFGLLGTGSVNSARVAGSRVVVDRLPVVELPREPGDVAVGNSTMGDVHGRLGDSLVGDSAVEATDGSGTLAAMLPLTPGNPQVLQIVDGREATSVAPADLERVVAGWRSHLDSAATVELPGWPKHLPTSLTSSLLGRVVDTAAPLGDDLWTPVDDCSVLVALTSAGVEWAAATVVDEMLTRVENGAIRPADWPVVGSACARFAGLATDDEVLRRHDDTVARLIGLTVTSGPGADQIDELVDAVRRAAGERSAADAASISPGVADPPALVRLARLGIELSSAQWEQVGEVLDTMSRPFGPADVALSIIVSARTQRNVEGVIAVRALAGTTWRWPTRVDSSGRPLGSGDSPHARAAIAIALRTLAVRETSEGLDLAPGFSREWLGKSVDVRDLPTRWGRVSYSLRWHGARPALLWELSEPRSDITIRCAAIDPDFVTDEDTGETLLGEPAIAGRG